MPRRPRQVSRVVSPAGSLSSMAWKDEKTFATLDGERRLARRRRLGTLATTLAVDTLGEKASCDEAE